MKSKILFWTPRIITILFIIFISLFAFDVFNEGYGFPEVFLALFMHLIPTLVLTGILLVAWRWENFGGYIYLFMGVFFGFFFDAFEELISFLLLVVPLWIVGGLFLADYYVNKKGKSVKKVKKKKKKKVKRKKNGKRKKKK